ncbi:MAG: hypothetical protein CUN56_07440 [Phototrophicales bacterium]|nr:MAG: hypothetical protein CUN56_07440 [Phototrophicales bacterium]RMG76405.1 MAG: hypothetical protein D6711_04015 [Chloroflexota bacterium]
MQNPTPARRFAGLILLIGMITSGASASVALAGNTTLSLQICLGGVGVAIIMLLIGGVLVALSK